MSLPKSKAFVISCRCLFIGSKRSEVSLVNDYKFYQCCVKIQRFHGAVSGLGAARGLH